MQDINNIKDNEYMDEYEYIDAELASDNLPDDDAHRIALEIWNDVKDNDIDNNDIGGSLWPQILHKILEEVKDEEIALEVREIIWEEHIPTLDL